MAQYYYFPILKTRPSEVNAYDALDDSVKNGIAEISQTDQVKTLLEVLGAGEASGAEAMRRLSLSHKPTFRQNYLAPALEHGLIERTDPDSPRSPRQKYRLTAKGVALRKSFS